MERGAGVIVSGGGKFPLPPLSRENPATWSLMV